MMRFNLPAPTNVAKPPFRAFTLIIAGPEGRPARRATNPPNHQPPQRAKLVRANTICRATPFIALATLSIFLSGCTGQKSPSATNPVASSRPSTPLLKKPDPYVMDTARVMMTVKPIREKDNHDPLPEIRAMVRMDVYIVDLPLGTVSDSAAFWEKLDEQSMGGKASRRLNRNGIRCGIAPRSEWPSYGKFFDNEVGKARRSQVTGFKQDTIELPVDNPIDHEDLFFYPPEGRVRGQSFDQCVNGLAMTFGPAPRAVGYVRATVCPVIKSQVQHLEFSPTNHETEVFATEVKRLYDAAFTIDIPDDSFLIISPMAGVSTETSLGGRFLLKDEKSERLEQVLIVAPTFMPTNGKAFDLTGPMVRSSDK